MNVSLRLKNCCTLGLDGTKSGVVEDMDRRTVFMLVYITLMLFFGISGLGFVPVWSSLLFHDM